MRDPGVSRIHAFTNEKIIYEISEKIPAALRKERKEINQEEKNLLLAKSASKNDKMKKNHRFNKNLS